MHLLLLLAFSLSVKYLSNQRGPIFAPGPLGCHFCNFQIFQWQREHHLYRPDSDRTELLYELKKDIGETTNLAENYPSVAERLQNLANQARDELGDAITGDEGSNVRPIDRIE